MRRINTPFDHARLLLRDLGKSARRAATPRTSYEWMIGMIVGLLFGWLGTSEFYRWHLLHDGPIHEVQATVIDARRSASRKSTPYQLKYEFLAQDGTRFQYTDQWLVPDSWVRVDRTTWDIAERTHRVLVRYAPSDPRIIQPVSTDAPGLLDAIGFSAISVLAFLAAVFAWRFSPKGGRRPG